MIDSRWASKRSPVVARELVELGRLAAEDLDDAHPGDVLLEEGVDRGDRLSHAPVARPHLVAEDHRRDEQEREHDEGDERETEVQVAEHHHDPEEGEDVEKDRDRPRGEHFVQDFDVVREPRHEPPDGVLVEVRHFLALQVAEDLHPHVVHHALADVGHEVDLDVARDERDDENAQEDRRRSSQSPAYRAPASIGEPGAMYRSIAILTR